MSLSFLLSYPEDISLSALKLIKLKKSILKRSILDGEATISELSKETDFSVPTITKIIAELIDEDTIFELGKVGTSGGRRPTQYAVNPKAGYYLGVEVRRSAISIGIQDFNNSFIKLSENIAYTLENTMDSLIKLCEIINEFVVQSEVQREKIVGACINLSGRINSKKGVSYNYFYFEEEPLSKIIESQIHLKTFLENDTRAMAYGEFNEGVIKNERDLIFVNMGLGIGIGIICNGQLYYGKSGYSGEFGHSPVFDNEIICQCGKKGCLETETSGIALERKFKESMINGSRSILSEKKKLEEINLDDILQAIIESEDSLALEILEDIGQKIGRYLSLLINVFNPESVVIGGTLSTTGMGLLLPIKTSINKYSINLVSQDMALKISSLGAKAGIIGACYILRDKLFYTSK